MFGAPQQSGGFGAPQPGFGQLQAGGFGQNAAVNGFGGMGQQPPQMQGGGFGQQQQQQQAGGFGGGFGNAAAGGGFGAAPQQNQMGGGFGASAGGFNQQQQGGFNQGQMGGAGGGFNGGGGGFGGQQQQQQPAQGFGTAGGFGQQQQHAGQSAGFGSGGGFGQPAGGGFGSNQMGGAGGFGAGSAGGGGFGGAATAGGFGAARPPGAGGFGQGGMQQPQQQMGGAFGAAANTGAGGFGMNQQAGGFGKPASGGLGQGGFGAAAGGFGQNKPPTAGFPQQPQQAGGGFGAGGFGQQQQQQQPATGGFGGGGFGSNTGSGFGRPQQPQQQGQQPGAGGGFGGFNAGNNTAGGGFGAAGGFGQKPAGTGGFGTQQQQQQPQQQQGGGFGTGAAMGGGFGTGGFGNTGGAAGGFGAAGAGAGGGFGGFGGASGAGGGFGAPQQQQQQQQQSAGGFGMQNQQSQLGGFGMASGGGGFGGQAGGSAAAGAPAPAPAPRPVITDYDFLTLPDYASRPYGEIKMFADDAAEDVVELPKKQPVVRPQLRSRLTRQLPHESANSFLMNQPAALPSSAIATANLFAVDEDDELPPRPSPHDSDFASLNADNFHTALEDAFPQRTLDDALPPPSAAPPARASPPRQAAGDPEPRASADLAPSASAPPPPWEEKRQFQLEPRREERQPPVAAAQSTHVVVPAPSSAPRQQAAESKVLRTIDLPYELPALPARDGAEPIKVLLPPRDSRREPVYYVNAGSSSLLRQTQAHRAASQTSAAPPAPALLARSFRVCCAPGSIVLPTFAAIRDGLEPSPSVDEVAGAGVKAVRLLPWHRGPSMCLPACTFAALRWLLPLTEAHVPAGADVAVAAAPFAKASVTLQRARHGSGALSEEKLAELLSVLGRARPAQPGSSVERDTLRQCRSVITLLSALYALPDADVEMENPAEEQRYLRQLRHRNLVQWLTAELSGANNGGGGGGGASPGDLVQLILSHRLGDARRSAESAGMRDLSKVVQICGEGNQFGAYVKMIQDDFPGDGAAVRERVVDILSGTVEPFIREEPYQADGSGGGMRACKGAATWKQLLGIFAFYGCTPDTPAETIVLDMLSRLEQPQARRARSLPPYAERLSDPVARTTRGADCVRRGTSFEDACLLLLEGFAHGEAPPSSCLHPHASSYCATEFLTPFIIVLCVRSLGLPRSASFVDAEHRTLTGLAGVLESAPDAWYWALLPLHLIEDGAARTNAVRAFCHRNAARYTATAAGPNAAEMDQLLAALHLRRQELEEVAAPAERAPAEPLNRPSIKTHVDIEQAFQKLLERRAARA